VVIASKIVHFWHAELAPMIDVNVANAWKDIYRPNDARRGIDAKPQSSSHRSDASPPH